MDFTQRRPLTMQAAEHVNWHRFCFDSEVMNRIAQLFILKNGFEAGLIIYALALGAVLRGAEFLTVYPGGLGLSLFAACLLTVLIAGASLVDGVRARRAMRPERRAPRRAASRARRV